MAAHPYQHMPDYTRWSRSIAQVPAAEVDPVVNFPFKIQTHERVATAGSCFAQHIARHLKSYGFNYYVAEDGHPIGDEQLRSDFGYGMFSARYGNIYTSRQLLQLFQRALGQFTPVEDHWLSSRTSGYLDPLRPNIQPNGFTTLEELRADRQHHLARVREMMENLDYFVFTLGLTELWYDRRDGTAYPVCPGTVGGDYDESVTGFRNLTVDDVVSETAAAFNLLLRVNPRAKIVLTVSPVPLIATAAGRHVLTSTTYSKSVLRVAAEELTNRFSQAAYFPSYEIITGGFNRGAYYGPDLRDVTEDGVGHVMRLFLKHGTDLQSGDFQAEVPAQSAPDESQQHLARMAQVAKALCDEELLEQVASESD